MSLWVVFLGKKYYFGLIHIFQSWYYFSMMSEFVLYHWPSTTDCKTYSRCFYCIYNIVHRW